MIRLLHANPNAKPGSWGKAECADALLQIASTVETLSQQLDRVWSLAQPAIRDRLDAVVGGPVTEIDIGYARRIEALAVLLQDQADAEAA